MICITVRGHQAFRKQADVSACYIPRCSSGRRKCTDLLSWQNHIIIPSDKTFAARICEVEASLIYTGSPNWYRCLGEAASSSKSVPLYIHCNSVAKSERT